MQLRRRRVPRPQRRRTPGRVGVDFERLLKADTLVTDPPASSHRSSALLGWLDDRLDWVERVVPFR